MPVSVYRLGRFDKKHPRLLKVLRRAPRLKHFRVSGLFIRPSLPKSERDRLRNERVARRSNPNAATTHSHPQYSDSAQSCNLTGDVDVTSLPANANSTPPEEMYAFLALLNFYSFDIVALTETWLSSKDDTLALLGGCSSHYEVLRCDRKRTRGGGVALLVCKQLYPNLFLKSWYRKL
ncbi:hypothetical protein COOONC_13196 [Cooperia oncophora]